MTPDELANLYPRYRRPPVQVTGFTPPAADVRAKGQGLRMAYDRQAAKRAKAVRQASKPRLPLGKKQGRP